MNYKLTNCFRCSFKAMLQVIPLSALLSGSLACLPLSPPASAQTDCSLYDREVKPSPTQRTVELKQFGISIKIPSNYRTMLLRDGSVHVLNPADYDVFSCVVKGGRGGSGWYSQRVKSVPNPERLPLKSLITQSGTNSKIQPYKLLGLTGFLEGADSDNDREYEASFWVEIPGIDQVVVIGVGCDCPVNTKDVTTFLQGVSLLNKN